MSNDHDDWPDKDDDGNHPPIENDLFADVPDPAPDHSNHVNDPLDEVVDDYDDELDLTPDAALFEHDREAVVDSAADEPIAYDDPVIADVDHASELVEETSQSSIDDDEAFEAFDDDAIELEQETRIEEAAPIAMTDNEIELTQDDRQEQILAAPARAIEEPNIQNEPSTSGGGIIGTIFGLAGTAFAAGALGFVGAAVGVGVYFNHLSESLPDFRQLANYSPAVTTRVYAGDGSLVAEFARERRLFVPIEQMPAHVKDAFVSAEDKSFYEHTGVDARGLVRSQISNISNILNNRRLEGGSTITQQVAKNFLLTSEQRIERKVREMMISRRMEETFTKDHILELYLNEIYLGNRSYGVAAAALNYFDKSLADLTIAEASYLAAITKGPSNYHPIQNEDRAVARRNWVIGRLLADGKITQGDADEARAQPLGASIAPPLGARDWTMEYFAEEVRKQIVDLYGVEALYDGGLSVRTSVDPKMQAAAGRALRQSLVDYDQRHGWRGAIDTMNVGDDWLKAFSDKLDSLRDERRISDDLSPWRPVLVYDVADTQARIRFEDGGEGIIPLDQMKWAREYISVNKLGDEITKARQVLSVGDIVYVDQARVLTENDEGELVNAPDAKIIDGAFALRQPPDANGGLIAIDPHTGRVLAMVGGFSFRYSEFNRAIQAERQPGSTFKPFVYSAALDSGYTPASNVLDAPFVAPGVDSWYKPGNYIEGRYYGNSTLRLGIEQSRNAMTARLAQDLGIGRIMDYVDRFKLSKKLPRELAISLGAGETTLMRITAAYSIFVNGGRRVQPVLIDRVQDRNGKTIYKRDSRKCYGCDAPVWAGQAEPQLTDPREQVLDPRTAYQITSILEGVVVRGTGTAVRRASSKPLAGKTGTTNDYKDAWFVGFSPDLAAGVYVGFDIPQTLGQGESGGKVAAPIFARFMTEALTDTAGIPFRVPAGVRLIRVNAKTGQPAQTGERNVILEAFKSGDVVSSGPSAEDLFLDPLSSAAASASNDLGEEESLDGLY